MELIIDNEFSTYLLIYKTSQEVRIFLVLVSVKVKTRYCASLVPALGGASDYLFNRSILYIYYNEMSGYYSP
jgi:hypothetical protein